MHKSHIVDVTVTSTIILTTGRIKLLISSFFFLAKVQLQQIQINTEQFFFFSDIPPMLLAMSLIYSFLLIAVFICSIELKTLHLFHCTYRLFAFSVVLYLMGILLQGVSYAKYGLTGLGPNTTLGTLFMGASEITFLTLVLLMAKVFYYGYTSINDSNEDESFEIFANRDTLSLEPDCLAVPQ